MTYRDELEAERARAAALEQENAELRAALAKRDAPAPSADTAAPASPSRKSGALVGVITILVIVALGGGITLCGYAVAGGFTHVGGTITSSGGELGAWTMTPDSCQSGERNQYRGASFYTSRDKRLGVAFLDPMGGDRAVTVNVPKGDNARRFNPSDCKVLEGQVERQSSEVNDVTNVKGWVKFDCAYRDEHVTGDVTFENCH